MNANAGARKIVYFPRKFGPESGSERFEINLEDEACARVDRFAAAALIFLSLGFLGGLAVSYLAAEFLPGLYR